MVVVWKGVEDVNHPGIGEHRVYQRRGVRWVGVGVGVRGVCRCIEVGVSRRGGAVGHDEQGAAHLRHQPRHPCGRSGSRGGRRGC